MVEQSSFNKNFESEIIRGKVTNFSEVTKFIPDKIFSDENFPQLFFPNKVFKVVFVSNSFETISGLALSNQNYLEAAELLKQQYGGTNNF